MGRLRQIVSGKDVKLLDDGGGGGQQLQGRGEGRVKICYAASRVGEVSDCFRVGY